MALARGTGANAVAAGEEGPAVNHAFHVTWIDAQTTARRTDGGTTRDGRNLTPPAGGDDWMLLLDRR